MTAVAVMSKSRNIPAPYLTPEDVCAVLQVTASTLANWRSLKTGPPFSRIGGLVRYNPDEFQAWLAAQRVP